MNEPTEDPRTDPVGVSDGGAASTASTANSGGAGGGGPTGGPSSGPVAEWADTFAADWPKKAADAVDLVVDNVHDRVIRPVMLGARAVVFGLLVGVIAVTFVVLFCIMALRFLDAYVSNGHVWISYFILGGLFTVGGFACWYFRTPSAAPPPLAADATVTEHRTVLVAGSGPAGLTAAIYSARAQLAPVVIEGEPSSTSDQPGGQLMLTTDVENFPGFPDGVMGPELMASMRAQAGRFGAEFVTAKVSRFDLSASPFGIWVGDPEPAEPTYAADALIVATGARSLMLCVPGEDRLLGHGVSTCATCDGFFFRSQEIAVVGGGDSALEEALFLTRFADKVTLVHRRDSLRASRIMQDRARANPKVEFHWNAQVTEVRGEDRVESVGLRDTVSGEESELAVTGLFVAIGHEPNTATLAGQLELEANGYVRTFGGSRTSVDGVFACGDVQDHVYRQAITAAGSGCTAAIDAERWLEARGQ